jgi:hypothetical protein
MDFRLFDKAEATRPHASTSDALQTLDPTNIQTTILADIFSHYEERKPP